MKPTASAKRKAPSKIKISGPYAQEFINSPAFAFLPDFIAAARQEHVRLSSLLGIAYQESSFFANTPPGTSVMGAISGPGNHQGLAGARAQIYEAARLLHGYNSSYSQVTRLNYYNTGHLDRGYGQSAASIGNSFSITGAIKAIKKKSGSGKSAPVYGPPAPRKPNKGVFSISKVISILESHGAHNITHGKADAEGWVTILGVYQEGIGLPFGIGVGQVGFSGKFAIQYNIYTGKTRVTKAPQGPNPVAGIGDAVSGLPTAFFSAFGTWFGKFKGWHVVLFIGALLVLIGAASKLATGSTTGAIKFIPGGAMLDQYKQNTTQAYSQTQTQASTPITAPNFQFQSAQNLRQGLAAAQS